MALALACHRLTAGLTDPELLLANLGCYLLYLELHRSSFLICRPKFS